MAGIPANKPTVTDELVETMKTIEGLPIKRQAPTPWSPYLDEAKNWTIGYGHKMSEEEVKRYKGKEISPEEADALLRKDILKHQDRWISAIKEPLTQNQLIALTSFAYHGGPGAMKAIVARINQGDWEGTKREMLSWNKMTVTDSATGEERKVTNQAFVERRAWETTRLDLGDDAADAASSYNNRKGLVQRVFDYFKSPQPKMWDRPEFDVGILRGENARVLEGLRVLCSEMGAHEIPFDIDEIVWTRKTIMEGSGGIHG